MLKKVLVTITAAAVLGVAGISVAGAATNSGSSKATSVTTTPSDDAATKACAQRNQRGAKNGARRGQQHQRRAVVVKTAATAIGIESKALVEALKAGQSIAEVTVAHNVSAATVVEAMVEAASAKIDARVAAGTITTEKATKVKSRLPELFERLINHKRAKPITSPQA